MDVKALNLNRFKENSPVKTVEKIRAILDANGIQVEEHWFPESSIGTCSLRVNIAGTLIGSNGKGINREYARASAYAEFIERLQNNKLTGNAVLSNIFRRKKSGPYMCANEEILDAYTLAEEKNTFVNSFLRSRNVDPEDTEAAAELLRGHQKMDFNILHEKDRFICLPYYSETEDRTVHIPYFIANLHYGSNGMCAGNSKHEALVQGLSEIIERMAQTKIIMAPEALPDIPEEYIKKYPEIYKMYLSVKNQYDKYSILVKDCSFSSKCPVVALVIVEKQTGRFGCKAGCHPDLRIALERLFTEATQGISLDKFSKKTVFNFMNTGVSNRANLMNSFKTADAYFPYQLLAEDPSLKFCEPESIENCDNEALYERMKSIFTDKGYDILVRDVSFLGFDSYHIIVPGCSEMNAPDDMYFEAENTRFHIQPFLQRPEFITEKECRYILSVVKYFKGNLLENSMKILSGCMLNQNYPAGEYGLDQYYFMAMCHAFLGQYKEAAEQMQFVNAIVRNKEPNDNTVFYLSLEHYFQGRSLGKDHAEVMQFMNKLFDNTVCERLDDILSDREKIFVKQYLSVDLNDVSYDDTDVPECVNEFITFEKISNNIVNTHSYSLKQN